MKKLLIILTLSLSAYFSIGQSQRMVLIEEGTNASCGPCAAQNPAFKTLLDANTTKVIPLKYQWYFPGYDPMHDHNPTEANGRFDTYYAQNGVPTAMIDGNVPTFGGNPYDGAPAGFTQDLIDTRYAVPASFDIDLTYSLTPETITVTATTTCTQAANGNFKLRIAVVEKQISFATAPGSNGETEFYSVMKKFLPNADGISMSGSYAAGETFTTTQTWDLANIYDINEVAVVAFIQNDANKEVMQSKLAEGLPVTPAFITDAVAASISGIDGFSCVGTITPSVTIQNYGSAALTSLNVGYEINGTTGSIPWTGNLDFYETANVSLGTINFTPDSDNILNVTTSNPNGSTDQNTSNDVEEAEIGLAGEATLSITVQIRTDYYPGETSWEIREDNGTLVASQQYSAGTADQFGGGGADATTTKSHQVTLAANKCYSFKLFDSFGDGMGYTGGVTTAPPFGYKILASDGEIIIQDQSESFNFGAETENALRTGSFFNGQIVSTPLISNDPAPIIFNVFPQGCPSFSYQWYSFNGIASAPTGSSTIGWTFIPGANSNSYDPPLLSQSTSFACFVTPSAGCGTAGWAAGVSVFNNNPSECVFNPEYQGEPAGVYPDTLINLPNVTFPASNYNASLFVVTPTSPNFNLFILGSNVDVVAYIDAVRVNSIIGLPNGFSYTPNEPVWNNGGNTPNFSSTQGCINFLASQASIQDILDANPSGAEFPIVINLDYRIANTNNPLANAVLSDIWLSEATSVPGLNEISVLGYKIKILPNLLGTINSGTSQIQSGFNPSAISFSYIPSNCPSYTYQWYSFNGIASAPTGSSTSGWTLIPGANSTTYDPPALFQSTSFACFVTPSAGCGGSGWASGVSTFTVTSNAGQIDGVSVQQCGTSAVPLSFLNAPSGLGNATFQWFAQYGNVPCPQGSSSSGWQSVIGANTATALFTPPGDGIYTLACLVTPDPILGLPPQWASGCKIVETESYIAQSIIGNPNIQPFTPFTYLVNQTAGNTYSWQVTGGAISSGQNTNQVNVIWAATGPYLLQLIESNGICSDTSSLSIQSNSCVLGVNAASIDPTTFCNGASAALIASSAPNVTYQWQLNGSNILNATNDTLIATSSGSYQVIATLDANCSAISLPIVITELPQLIPPGIVLIGNAITCNSEPATLEATGNFSTFLWNNGENGSSIQVTESGTYSVTGFDSFNCSIQSLPQEINLALLPPVNICLVSVDSLTGRNIIVWEKPQTTLIDSFIVFRESEVANVYMPIASKAYSEFSTFIDPIANPQVQASRYKLGLVDTCGTLSTTSEFHKTIHLTMNLGVGGTVNLIWSNYEGLNFGSYKIYRGTSADDISELVTIQSNLNSYTDLTPPTGNVFYQIGIVVPLCNPTAFGFAQSRSNIANTGAIGFENNLDTDVLIYPNPASESLKISGAFNLNGYTIFDQTGRLVQSGKCNNNDYQIHLNKLVNGIYFIKIDTMESKSIFKRFSVFHQ
jgi:hypothetical protein